MLTFTAMDLGEEKQHLRRTPWNNFPDVEIFSPEIFVKEHPLYSSAKEGNAIAAEGLIEDVLAGANVAGLKRLLDEPRPFLLPVHAVESEGMNVIPRVFARALSNILDLPVFSGVIQINRVTHTGASGYHRLAFPAIFDGEVVLTSYLLVDDFVGQGGTLANLRGFIETKGGAVIAAVALTGKSYSAELRPEEGTLDELRRKHGKQLEEWWFATFGYGFERLTQSEARYLIRVDDAHAIPERLATARRARD
jgi:hypothetical protein